MNKLQQLMMYTAGTAIWLWSVILGSVHSQFTITMDSDIYCGKAIDIYDREYVIKAKKDMTASTRPNYRCVITIRSGYTDSNHGIQITHEMIYINDCGVRLNIYAGSSPGGTVLKRFSCSSYFHGILYSEYSVTFELITHEELYNPTRNDFIIKVKTFQYPWTLNDSVAEQKTNIDNLNKTEDVYTRVGKLQQQIVSNSARVAMTACVVSSLFLSSGSVVKFDDIKTQTGISNLSSFRDSGKFTSEIEGLYRVTSLTMSNTNAAQFAIYCNGDSFASAYVMPNDDAGTSIGSATAVVVIELKVGDTVWVQTKTRMQVGRDGSCLTIAKLK